MNIGIDTMRVRLLIIKPDVGSFKELISVFLLDLLSSTFSKL